MGQGFIKKNGKPPSNAMDFEQLVNYTLLYHFGDEGVSGGWTWKDVSETGGYKPASFPSHTFNKNADNMYFFGDANGSYNYKGGIFTNNSLDLSQWVCAFIKSNISYGKQTFFSLQGFPEGSTDYADSNRIELVNVLDTDANGNPYHNFTPFALRYFSPKSGKYNVAFHFMSSGYNSDMGWTVYHCSLFKPDYGWETMCSLAGIEGVIDRDEFFSNREKISTVLSNESSVNYMIKRCTGEFMGFALMSSAFLSALASSPYKEKVYANEHWAKFLALAA